MKKTMGEKGGESLGLPHTGSEAPRTAHWQ